MCEEGKDREKEGGELFQTGLKIIRRIKLRRNSFAS